MFNAVVSESDQGDQMSKVRGVRFSESEEQLIEEFLRRNSVFDFSTLAKVAILAFIKNPEVQLIGVREDRQKERKNGRPVTQ